MLLLPTDVQDAYRHAGMRGDVAAQDAIIERHYGPMPEPEPGSADIVAIIVTGPSHEPEDRERATPDRFDPLPISFDA